MEAKCSPWPAKKRSGAKITVLVPASVITTEHTLELKTLKVASIVRSLAIFRVDNLIIYLDKYSTADDLKLMKLLAEFLLTPPHLRKKKYKLMKELRYVGEAPPIQVPTHEAIEVKGAKLVAGYVEKCLGRVCLVYLGREGYGVIRDASGIEPGNVVIVRMSEATVEFEGQKYVEVRPLDAVEVYRGFTISLSNNIVKTLRDLRSKNFFILGTSRYGDCPSLSELHDMLRGVSRLAVAFGGPYAGLLEYVPKDLFDALVNFAPHQGTKTIRTEEALFIVLSIINYILRR